MADTPPASSEGTAPSETLHLHVKRTDGSADDIDVPASATIADVAKLVATVTSIPPEQQRLVWRGRVLKHDKTMSEYGAS